MRKFIDLYIATNIIKLYYKIKERASHRCNGGLYEVFCKMGFGFCKVSEVEYNQDLQEVSNGDYGFEEYQIDDKKILDIF